MENSGQAADAKTTGDAITSLNEDIDNKLDKYIETISVNRFNKNAVSAGALNAGNGEVINQDSATTLVSDFCDISKRNETGLVTLARKSGTGWLTLQTYAFYDTNMEYITGSYTYQNPLAIPENAKYIRVQIANYTHANNTVVNVGDDLNYYEYEYSKKEIVIPTKTSELENDSGYVTNEEIEGMLPPDCSTEIDKLNFENKNLKKRCMSLENLNKFAWASCDKGYISLVVDDGSSDLGCVYEIAQEYGITISAAIPPERLTNTLSGSTITGTVKDVCDLIVSNGGEIFTHTLSSLSQYDEITDDVLYQYYAENKKKLENAGYTINGIITAGSGHPDKAESLKWVRQYYLYSDSEGQGQGYPQYSKPRYLLYANNTNNTIDAMKTRITNANNNKTWLCIGMHTINAGDEGVLNTSESALREVLELIKTYVDAGTMEVVTYNYMYNNFASTELEQRLIALENA